MNFIPNLYENFWYITEIHVTATGGEKVVAGWGGVPQVFNPEIERTNLKIDDAFDNVTVSNGQTRNFYAWNTLALSDFEIQSGGSSEIKALTNIELSSEFYAANGSEVHIWCGPVYPDCNDFQNFKSNSVPDYLINEEKINASEINIQFVKTGNYLSVSPNPGSGSFTVKFYSASNDRMQKIQLLDLSGRLLFEKSIAATEVSEDLSVFPAGIYFFKVVDNQGDNYTQKIVIQ
jgi:hypothetical protein